MGIEGIARIEEFEIVKSEDTPYDPMLRRLYRSIDQDVYTISKQPDPVIYIDDIAAYNQQEGLALSEEEMTYLKNLSERIGRKLTDSEVFGFSQVNSRALPSQDFQWIVHCGWGGDAFDPVRSDQKKTTKGQSGPCGIGLQR